MQAQYSHQAQPQNTVRQTNQDTNSPFTREEMQLITIDDLLQMANTIAAEILEISSPNVNFQEPDQIVPQSNSK